MKNIISIIFILARMKSDLLNDFRDEFSTYKYFSLWISYGKVVVTPRLKCNELYCTSVLLSYVKLSLRRLT